LHVQNTAITASDTAAAMPGTSRIQLCGMLLSVTTILRRSRSRCR
jgi:hypothetical protein